jgi:hypothetical protein
LGARSLGDASEIVVVMVWATGALLIIGLASLASRLLAGRQTRPVDPRHWRG